jgi:hypothetical protein
MLTACVTNTGLSEDLDRSVKAYNRMLRWHEIENAVIAYMEPDQVADHLKQADILKNRGLSVTDYRILSTQYIPEKRSGDVVAEFDYFLLPSNRIKTVSYRQEWLYMEKTKSWKLKSRLPAFE